MTQNRMKMLASPQVGSSITPKNRRDKSPSIAFIPRVKRYASQNKVKSYLPPC